MSAPRKEVLAEGVEVRVKPCMARQPFTTIYGLCDPDSGEIRYIGKTIYKPERRLTYHLTACRKSIVPSARWMERLRKSGKRPAIIELDTAGDDWANRERFWIEFYRGQGARLLNLSDGGDGVTGIPRTKEWNEKIAAAIRTGSNFQCDTCGKTFWRKRYEINRGNNKFCSRGCFKLSLKGLSRPVSIQCMAAGIAAAASRRRAQTHCKRGHELSGSNLFITQAGSRGCKECRKLHKLAYRARGGK